MVIAASCIAFAHSVWFAWNYFQATPWLDMWDWVGEFRAWPAGHFGWRDLIAQHNDHRIATARVLFLADTLFFHMSGRFVTTVNMALLSLLGLLLHRVWRSRAVVSTRYDLPSIFFVAVMASTCQWENLVTPFQVQFALLLVFVALATILLVHGTSPGMPRPRSRALLLAAGLSYGLAVFSMAGGVLLLPILLILLVARRAEFLAAVLFAVPAVLALPVFFHGYDWHSFGIIPLRPLGFTWLSIAYRMAAIGLEFLGAALGGVGGGAAIVAGGLGLGLLVAHITRAWRSGRAPADAEAVFLALAVFVLANAIAAARLRGYFSFWGGLASRYAALSLLFFISMAGLMVQAIDGRMAPQKTPEPRGTAIGIVLPPLLAIAALAAFNLPPGFAQQAASLQRALQSAGTTLQQGVYDPGRIGILNPFGLDRVIDNVRFAEHRRLSVFAASGRPPARIRAVLRDLDPGRLATCPGAENILYRLDASRAVLRAWLATPDPTRTVRWVQLRDEGGQPQAVLPAQELRDEDPLGPAHAPILGVFVGFTAALNDGPLILIGVPESGPPCRIIVRGPGPARIQPPPDTRLAQLPLLDLAYASPAWAEAGPGMPKGMTPLWPDSKGPAARIWTSTAQGDSGTGDMTMRVAAPGAGLGLAVPFATGPDPDGQSLLFRAQDGTQVDLPVPGDAQPGEWRLAALPPAWLARHAGTVTITARDRGRGDGQWLAVAGPTEIRLDPDAAELDRHQPKGTRPVFTLIPAG